MRTLYNDMDIRFSLEGVSFHALNIVFEHFERTIPAHATQYPLCHRSPHRACPDPGPG